jgi:hypothetical protein
MRSHIGNIQPAGRMPAVINVYVFAKQKGIGGGAQDRSPAGGGTRRPERVRDPRSPGKPGPREAGMRPNS